MTWRELNPATTSTPSVNFCNFSDLGYPLVMCWIILALRFTLERGVFRAIGISAGITIQGDIVRWCCDVQGCKVEIRSIYTYSLY